LEASFILKNTPKADANLPPTITSTDKEPESGKEHDAAGRQETPGEGGGMGVGGEEGSQDMWASLEERDEEQDGFRCWRRAVFVKVSRGSFFRHTSFGRKSYRRRFRV